jgi:hypothetical protein
VPQSAVAGHLGHGDSEGECGALADCTTNADLCTTCQVCDTEAKICVPKCAPGEECDLTDGTCSGGGGGCPGGCTENATCVNGVCICDEGFKPDPGTGACIPDDTGECPGKCFFIRAREACFTCPKGSKATAQGTCRCQHKARECQDLFGGKRVKPVRCQNG